MARLLKPVKHHGRNEIADMQRWRRTVISDIGRQHAGAGFLIKSLEIRALMDKAAIHERAEKVGFRRKLAGHMNDPFRGREM